MIDRAEGGVLFIDEAHSLADQGRNDFGRVAVGLLLRALENRRGQLAILVAGYPAEMDAFLASDPGLRDRFTRFIDFPDYSAPQLSQIFQNMATAEGFLLSDDARHELASICLEMAQQHGPDFGNARLIRRLFDAARNCHALRLVNTPPGGGPRFLDRLERPDMMGAAKRLTAARR